MEKINFGLTEDRNKNDITIVKRGDSIELSESRDIADKIQVMTGKTTMPVLRKFFEESAPGVHIGHVFVIVSAHEKCPDFLVFLKKQARRLEFKLIVFVSPLPAAEIKSFEQHARDTGQFMYQQ